MHNITEPFDGLDLQWHAVDGNGDVAYFKSGGGGVPLQIADIDFDEVADYFNNLPEIVDNNNVIINPGLEWVVKFDSRSQKDYYLENNLFFARRGLVCYDKVYVSRLMDPRYHLVAYPSLVLDISDVSPFILHKLAKSREGFKFINHTTIDISEVF
jgi:hypothetical protein